VGVSEKYSFWTTLVNRPVTALEKYASVAADADARKACCSHYSYSGTGQP